MSKIYPSNQRLQPLDDSNSCLPFYFLLSRSLPLLQLRNRLRRLCVSDSMHRHETCRLCAFAIYPFFKHIHRLFLFTLLNLFAVKLPHKDNHKHSFTSFRSHTILFSFVCLQSVYWVHKKRNHSIILILKGPATTDNRQPFNKSIR